jgi:6-phosphofructokinase 1
MCSILKQHRDLGKRKSIIIVAEGAIDRNLQPITAENVKQVLIDQLGLDTRVTTLGHTQRGGRPCAYDRILASLQGCEAVEALLSAKPDTPSYIIGLAENAIIRQPMMEAVAQTQEVAKRIAAKDFNGALALRDPEFEECLQAFYASSRIDDKYLLPENQVGQLIKRVRLISADVCLYSDYVSV